jgi:hypothetical protein
LARRFQSWLVDSAAGQHAASDAGEEQNVSLNEHGITS